MAFAAVCGSSCARSTAPKPRWKWNTNARNNFWRTSCRQHRRPAQGSSARHDRRPLRRRVDPCSPTSPASPNAPARSRPAIWWLPGTDLQRVRPAGGSSRPRRSRPPGTPMVVSGVPNPRADHAQALAALALDMAQAVARMRDPQGHGVGMRIGLASGPVVAGVVGSRRFFYDVWGDAVNVASRMEAPTRRGASRCRRTSTNACATSSRSPSAATSTSRTKGVMHTWYPGRPAGTSAPAADGATVLPPVSGSRR